MDGQRRLVITLAVEITIPADGPDFNSLIAAFQQFGDLTQVRLFECFLAAFEQEIGERLIREHPGRFAWKGRAAARPKRWVLPFGEAVHHYRQMRDRTTRQKFYPLMRALSIPPRVRFTAPVLAGPLGLASEISFRKAASEAERLQGGRGPKKSLLWLRFQGFSESGLDPRPAPNARIFEVVIADGTKLKRQHQGYGGGLMDLRLVLSRPRAGGDLQVLAFDLEKTWPEFKARLLAECPGHEVEVLLQDGEEAIEALADARTRVQRCLVHGPRGLPFALYQDGLKKPDQLRFLRLFRRAEAWRMDAEALAELSDASRYYLRRLIDQAKDVCGELLDRLPLKAVHGRQYLERFLDDSLSYLRALVNGEEPFPEVTTNAAENAFSRMDLRLKEIGRRWSLEGALNMIRVLLTKIYNRPEWERHLALLAGGPGSVTITTTLHGYAWLP